MSRDYALHSFNPPVHLHIDYAAELNAQQHAAVTAPPGPSLVIAGAGSGKTRALTYRVGFLLEQGIPADRILLLTFTNKAAKEMMRRVSELLGQDLPQLWGGTFHGIGNRLLRMHADRLGYQRDFTILDREDAKDLIDACLGEAKIDMKATRFPKGEVVGEIFSLALNKCQTIANIVQQEYDYFSGLTAQLVDLQERYAARKRAANAMDFDDLLALWLKLLKENPQICEQYQRKFQFILVDEYQDTNLLQSELIDLLAARHHNLMVVGDDAQSIYAWRGANFQNILKFPERYPDAKVYKIETNYRSTPEILNVANAAIAANLNQFTKQLTPARKSGVKPVLAACMTASEQAAFVAQRVLELREEGVDMNGMAVLYRSHFHALELQLELTRRNIPFSITSGIRFFEQAHIKDATAYLKLAANPRDEIAFKRVVQLLPGIGGKGADKLWLKFSGELKVRGGNQADSSSTSSPQPSPPLRREGEETDGAARRPYQGEGERPAALENREPEDLVKSASSPQPSPPLRGREGEEMDGAARRPYPGEGERPAALENREPEDLVKSASSPQPSPPLRGREGEETDGAAHRPYPGEGERLAALENREPEDLAESASSPQPSPPLRGREGEEMDGAARRPYPGEGERLAALENREPEDLAESASSPQPSPALRGREGEETDGAARRPYQGGGQERASLAVALQACAGGVPKKAAVAWAQLAATISQLETAPARGNPARMLRLVVEAGYEDHLKETYANFRNRLEDIEQLAVFARQFPTTEDFLAQLALLTNLESEADQPASNDTEQLKLSTIHQAKGLEFDVVFVIMLCDGMFPSARSLDSTEGEEEERRLFYVALTRARNEIYLSYPLMRFLPGGSGDAMQQASRFLEEIPRDLLDEWNLKTSLPYG